MVKVLVTGAAGQIGYMTFDGLRNHDGEYDVYALDRQKTASERVPGKWNLNLPEDRFFRCDLTDYEGLRSAFTGMDTVVHLAADPEGDSWPSLLNNNVVGAYHVFEACREAGVKRIVAASSIMVSEGQQRQEPYRAMMERRISDIPEDPVMVTPDSPAEPRSLYGCSKVWMESLARTYAHEYNISCICVRIGQVERDRPRPPQSADIFVSQRDIVQMFIRCVAAAADIRFDIYYGLSNNDYRWVDIRRAKEKIGYVPDDRAEDNHDYQNR